MRLARRHLGQDALAVESIRREVRAASGEPVEETLSLFPASNLADDTK